MTSVGCKQSKMTLLDMTIERVIEQVDTSFEDVVAVEDASDDEEAASGMGTPTEDPIFLITIEDNPTYSKQRSSSMPSTPLQRLLSLLLLLLPSSLREHLSSRYVGVDQFHPIFLVPGVSCSDLEARLTEAYRPSVPHCGAMKGKGWFGLWKNNSELLAHDYVQCFQEQMSLVYDPAVNDYRNLPGVETRVPNFGSTRAFSHKNPVKPEWCLGKLRVALEKLGYRDGDTMFGAPYDIRYAPPVPGQTSEVYSRYFKEFMALIEIASKKKQKKVVIFGHSFGGMVAFEFVRNTPLAWRQRYIKHLVLVAPTLSNGFMEPVKNFAAGTDILFVPTTTPLSTRSMWRSFESAIVNFPSPALFGHKPLVITKQRNYSAYDMEHFLTAVGFSEGIEPFRKRAIPKMMNFKAPMVPMTYINGVGNKTPLQLVFWENDFDASPEAVYGDGDGKINLNSVLAFDKEMCQQPGQKNQFKSIKIDKAQHSTIVTDDFALQRVIQEIIEVNKVSS
ncbi:Lecithin-cholesterol acyltransferase-like 1 [Dichanthelium oligosanthes]|uniref:Lecithin-cholesterol acyltransferase-like 1 n=1 Tax=Dichanthelium oligosanthes TaxID=888268 RepID=A0A1E5W2Y1_9POAL|nr:Lecithin-cholesterol acyltransferase-like 1 [Dichanthelium oligosanthes]